MLKFNAKVGKWGSCLKFKSRIFRICLYLGERTPAGGIRTSQGTFSSNIRKDLSSLRKLPFLSSSKITKNSNKIAWKIYLGKLVFNDHFGSSSDWCQTRSAQPGRLAEHELCDIETRLSRQETIKVRMRRLICDFVLSIGVKKVF